MVILLTCTVCYRESALNPGPGVVDTATAVAIKLRRNFGDVSISDTSLWESV